MQAYKSPKCQQDVSCPVLQKRAGQLTPKKRRTVGRTVAGHFSRNTLIFNEKTLSGLLSGAVRQVSDVRCLSGGCVFRHPTPDNRTAKQTNRSF